MHMSDALISPTVGLGLWAVAATGLVVASRRLEPELRRSPRLLPMMGVTGAFVFAAQMVNFTIPGTGASGHLGGAILLSALLGPSAGFVVIASVLLVQALLFADGGLLAYGANLVNMGLIPCFVLFPLIFKPLAGSVASASRGRLVLASVLAGVASLVVGSTGVALETGASGVTALPLPEFLAFIVPVHVLIGLGEGLITAGVLIVAQQQGMSMPGAPVQSEQAAQSGRGILGALALAAAICAGGLSLFASSNPDGLEWSVAKLTDEETLAHESASTVHETMSAVQAKTSLMPDYSIGVAAEGKTQFWRGSLAGIIGAFLTLALILGLAAMLRGRPGKAGPV